MNFKPNSFHMPPPLLAFALNEDALETAGSVRTDGATAWLRRDPILGSTAGPPPPVVVAAWHRPAALPLGLDAATSLGTIATECFATGTPGMRYGLYIDHQGVLAMRVQSSSSVHSTVETPAGVIKPGESYLSIGSTVGNRASLWHNGGQAIHGPQVALGATNVANFFIGARTANSSTVTRIYNGEIGPVLIATPANGSTFATPLDDAFSAWLYNGGAGRTYVEVRDALGPDLFEYYELDENGSVSRNGKVKRRPLSAVGPVTTGPPILDHRRKARRNEQVVRIENARSGRVFRASHALAPTFEDSPEDLLSSGSASGMSTPGATLLGRSEWDHFAAGVPGVGAYHVEESSDGWRSVLGITDDGFMECRLTGPGGVDHTIRSVDTIHGERPIVRIVPSEVTVTDGIGANADVQDFPATRLEITFGGPPSGTSPIPGQIHPFAQGDQVKLIDCGVPGEWFIDQITDTTIQLHVLPAGTIPSLGANPKIRATGFTRSVQSQLRPRRRAWGCRRRGDTVAFWAGWSMIGEESIPDLPVGSDVDVTTSLLAPASGTVESTNYRIDAVECPESIVDDVAWRTWAARHTIKFPAGGSSVGTWTWFGEADDCEAIPDRRRRWHYEVTWLFRRPDGSLLWPDIDAETGQAYSLPDGPYVSQVLPDVEADLDVTVDVAVVTPPLNPDGSTAPQSLVFRGQYVIRSEAPGVDWAAVYVSSTGIASAPGTADAPTTPTEAIKRLRPCTRLLLRRGDTFDPLVLGQVIGPVRILPYGDPLNNLPAINATSEPAVAPLTLDNGSRDVSIQGLQTIGINTVYPDEPGYVVTPNHIRIGSSDRRITLTDIDAVNGRAWWDDSWSNNHNLLCMDRIKFRSTSRWQSYTFYAQYFRGFAMTRLDMECQITRGAHLGRINYVDGIHIFMSKFVNALASVHQPPYFSFRGERTRFNLTDTDNFFTGSPTGISSTAPNKNAIPAWTDMKLTGNSYTRIARTRPANWGGLDFTGHGGVYIQNISSKYKLEATGTTLADPRQGPPRDWSITSNRQTNEGGWSMIGSSATTPTPTTGFHANHQTGGPLEAPPAPVLIASEAEGLLLRAGLPAGGTGRLRVRWWKRPIDGGSKTYLNGVGALLLFDPRPKPGSYEYGIDVIDDANVTTEGRIVTLRIDDDGDDEKPPSDPLPIDDGDDQEQPSDPLPIDDGDDQEPASDPLPQTLVNVPSPMPMPTILTRLIDLGAGVGVRSIAAPALKVDRDVPGNDHPGGRRHSLAPPPPKRGT